MDSTVVAAEIVDQAEELTQSVLGRFDLLTSGSDPGGISDPKYKVLSVVSKFGPISIGNAAKYTSAAQSTTSEMMARLVKAGLAKKVRADFDERVVMVEVTPEGENQISRRRKLSREALCAAMEKLNEEERGRFVRSLHALDDLLR